jgi:HSP20 family molecular chaperone IbpA
MSLLNHFLPSQTATSTQDNASELGNTVKPAYEIKETPEAFGLTVYLPGVAKDGLELTAEEGQVRIVGRRQWKQPEGWTSLYRESGDATFELVLEHDNAIDAEKITAELRDGILQATLPKHEAAKPRKIAVN